MSKAKAPAKLNMHSIILIAMTKKLDLKEGVQNRSEKLICDHHEAIYVTHNLFKSLKQQI